MGDNRYDSMMFILTKSVVQREAQAGVSTTANTTTSSSGIPKSLTSTPMNTMHIPQTVAPTYTPTRRLTIFSQPNPQHTIPTSL